MTCAHTTADEYELTYTDSWLDSCDWCDCQGDTHYCNLHGVVVKNMDITRCPKWEPRVPGREP